MLGLWVRSFLAATIRLYIIAACRRRAPSHEDFCPTALPRTGVRLRCSTAKSAVVEEAVNAPLRLNPYSIASATSLRCESLAHYSRS